MWLRALLKRCQLTAEGIAPVPSVKGGDALQGFFASKSWA